MMMLSPLSQDSCFSRPPQTSGFDMCVGSAVVGTHINSLCLFINCGTPGFHFLPPGTQNRPLIALENHLTIETAAGSGFRPVLYLDASSRVSGHWISLLDLLGSCSDGCGSKPWLLWVSGLTGHWKLRYLVSLSLSSPHLENQSNTACLIEHCLCYSLIHMIQGWCID